MIYASINNENQIELDIDGCEGECSYSLGDGIINILNYDLKNIKDFIHNYVINNINSENVHWKNKRLFLDELMNKLIEFHPYFYSVLYCDLQNLIINYLIHYIVKDTLFDGYEHFDFGKYKNENIYIPVPRVKKESISPISLKIFAKYVENLIGRYSGFIEDLPNKDLINSIREDLPTIFDETIIYTIFMYNNYLTIFKNEACSFLELWVDEIDVKDLNLNIFQKSVFECVETVFIGHKDNFLSRFTEYLDIKTNNDTVYNCYIHKDSFVYDAEKECFIMKSFQDLLYFELCHLAKLNYIIKSCDKCNKYILSFDNKKKQCDVCKKNRTSNISEVQKIYRKYYLKARNSIDNTKPNAQREKDVSSIYLLYVKLIFEIREMVNTRITLDEYKKIMDSSFLCFKSAKNGEMSLNNFELFCDRILIPQLI